MIRVLSPAEARAAVPALVDVLRDCVAGGASVSFMADMSRAEAETFWVEVADGVARGDRALIVAEEAGRIVGTVQVIPAGKPNQPHRGDVAKMLVHRAARGRGVGAALMTAAEDEARRLGLTLLVLDTVPGTPAERLYRGRGFSFVGIVPGFALWPDGRPCDTAFFYKAIG